MKPWLLSRACNRRFDPLGEIETKAEVSAPSKSSNPRARFLRITLRGPSVGVMLPIRAQNSPAWRSDHKGSFGYPNRIASTNEHNVRAEHRRECGQRTADDDTKTAPNNRKSNGQCKLKPKPRAYLGQLLHHCRHVGLLDDQGPADAAVVGPRHLERRYTTSRLEPPEHWRNLPARNVDRRAQLVRNDPCDIVRDTCEDMGTTKSDTSQCGIPVQTSTRQSSISLRAAMPQRWNAVPRSKSSYRTPAGDVGKCLDQALLAQRQHRLDVDPGRGEQRLPKRRGIGRVRRRRGVRKAGLSYDPADQTEAVAMDLTSARPGIVFFGFWGANQ